MKLVLKLLPAMIAAVTVLALPAPASAYVACNHDGDCWHTHERLRVPGVAFDYHPDSWYFSQHWDAGRHWHDYQEGRGYWRNGVWITL